METAIPLAEREELRDFLAKLPRLAGVYLMKDRRGKVIYVGKAINLRNRVRSYFNASGDSRPKVQFLLKRIFDIETLVTDSEKAALLLENTLIKKHAPRYNVQLRDDKSFLGLRLSVQDTVPRLSAVRRPKKDGAKYFGPFHSAGALHQVRRLLQRLFGVRVCNDTFFRNRTRPCLEYQIGRCLGPCIEGLVSDEDYAQAVHDTERFLKGKSDDVIKRLEAKMKEASDDQAYEEAMKHRNLIDAIKTTLSQQVVASHHREDDQDILGIYRDQGFVEVYILFVRKGQVVGGEAHNLGHVIGEDAEILGSVIMQRYSKAYGLPSEIILPVTLDHIEAIHEILNPKSLKISVPQRGQKRKLVDMAIENAKASFVKAKRKTERNELTLEEIKRKLYLPDLPSHIECYDISNFQGQEATGSMVVFKGAEPDKKSYRHYKIRHVQGPNDFAMMQEVLSRRFSKNDEHPNLIMIDGGKGQLNVAQAVLKELGLTRIPVVGLAKARTLKDGLGRSEERIFLPGRLNPVTFRKGSAALHLLQRIRDEAHRFAITHHRKLRKKATLKSELDDVPGIGPKRKQALLSAFGSVKNVKNATVKELVEKGGLTEALAVKIKDVL